MTTPNQDQITEAQTAVSKKLNEVAGQGRHNSIEFVEFRAFEVALNWITGAGDDPQRFERILFPERFRT